MDQPNSSPNLLHQIFRWTARIYAALAAGVMVLFFVGEGINLQIHLSLREGLMMAAFFLVWTGLLLGWKWELYGGILILVGISAFYLLDFAFSGTFPRGPFFFLLAAPGLFYLTLGLLSDPVPTSDRH